MLAKLSSSLVLEFILLLSSIRRLVFGFLFVVTAFVFDEDSSSSGFDMVEQEEDISCTFNVSEQFLLVMVVLCWCGATAVAVDSVAIIVDFVPVSGILQSATADAMGRNVLSLRIICYIGDLRYQLLCFVVIFCYFW